MIRDGIQLPSNLLTPGGTGWGDFQGRQHCSMQTEKVCWIVITKTLLHPLMSKIPQRYFFIMTIKQEFHYPTSGITKLEY